MHGLGSNPDTTWGPKDSTWVSQFLPLDIPAALHKDVRIFFYHYDSYWKRDAVQTRLRTIAESFLDDIEIGIRKEEGVSVLIAWIRNEALISHVGTYAKASIRWSQLRRSCYQAGMHVHSYIGPVNSVKRDSLD